MLSIKQWWRARCAGVRYWKQMAAYWESQCKMAREKQAEETARANKNYADRCSSYGEISKLQRKLARTQDWNRRQQIAVLKMKEQSALDHKFAQEQKDRIAELESKLAPCPF